MEELATATISPANVPTLNPGASATFNATLVLILADNGPLAVAALMTALAVAGYLASLFLPPAPGGN